MELTSIDTIAEILERHKAELLADWLKELQNTGLRPDQGKRILSITRGFSTITRLYCCLLRTVFPPVALLSLLKRYIWEFRN
jgi:hypothetical protein